MWTIWPIAKINNIGENSLMMFDTYLIVVDFVTLNGPMTMKNYRKPSGAWVTATQWVWVVHIIILGHRYYNKSLDVDVLMSAWVVPVTYG
jgi:hypothetical protein